MIQFLDSMHCGRVEWYRQKVFGPNRYVRAVGPLFDGCCSDFYPSWHVAASSVAMGTCKRLLS